MKQLQKSIEGYIVKATYYATKASKAKPIKDI